MLGDYAQFQEDLGACGDPLWRPHPDMVRSIRGREVTLDQGFDARCPDEFYAGGIELPECYIVTPNMEVARGEMNTILLNLVGAGAALGVLLFAEWSSLRMIILIGVSLLGGYLSVRQIRASAAIVRSLLRQEYISPPRGWAAIIGAAGIAIGVLLAYLVLKVPMIAAVEAAIGWESSVVRLGMAAAVLGLFWVLARPLSKYLIYDKAFN